MVARDAACVNLYQIQVQPMLPPEVIILKTSSLCQALETKQIAYFYFNLTSSCVLFVFDYLSKDGVLSVSLVERPIVHNFFLL